MTELRLNALDQLFLQLEGECTPMHVGAVLVFSPDEKLTQTLEQRLKHQRASVEWAEPFNLELRQPSPRVGRARWQLAERAQLSDHLHVRELAGPVSDEQLMEVISEIHTSPVDRTRPLWECYLIEGLADGRFATYFKVHHSCIDGVSAVTRLRNSLSTNPEDRTPPLWVEKRRKTRRPPRSRKERLHQVTAAVRGQARAVPEIARALRGQLRNRRETLVPLPYTAPECLYNQRISAERSVAWQRLPLAGLQAIGRATGSTVNEVVLTICAGALRHHLTTVGELPADPLIGLLPVSLRVEDSEEVGTRVGSILCNLATHLADPIERLKVVTASSQESKRFVRGLSAEAAGAYGLVLGAPLFAAYFLGLEDRVRMPFNVVISNVAGPAAPLYQSGAKLEAIYPTSLLFERQALNISLISYLDAVDFGLVACRRTIPNLEIISSAIVREYQDLHRAVLGQ